MEKVRLLDELAAEIKVCPKCRLSETRTNAVPGEGSPSARIMFVGEGPGENEDKTGRPFVGAAGNFLNTLLEEAGIEREDVFITNIVKCRPPGNRVPNSDEVEACNDYLMAQIAIIEPRFICTLGSSSMKTLLGPKLKITESRCKVYRKEGILYIPLFHPAAALHNPKLKDTLHQDMAKLRELLNRDLREDEIIDLSPKPLRSQCMKNQEAKPQSVEPETETKAEAKEDTLSLF